MLTIFSTPKRFRGHINVIQRNAIKSWTLLHPEIEVILIGNDDGAVEVCREFGIRHEPDVRRRENGPPDLDYIFERAQEIAKYNILCYVNCDIVLMSDFRDAVSRVTRSHTRFLIAGRRWDTDIKELWDFSRATWDVDLRSLVSQHGRLADCIDYFVFSRGLYDQMPPLLVGRGWWDNWLIWKAKRRGAAVVDATREVLAVHQNHDYYHPNGLSGILRGEDAMENIRLAGGKWHLNTLLEATHRLTREGEKHNWGHSWAPIKRNLVFPIWFPLWFAFLNVSRPLRHRFGLRQGFLSKARGQRRESE